MKLADVDRIVMDYRTKHGRMPREIRINPSDADALLPAAFLSTSSYLQSSEAMREMMRDDTQWYSDDLVPVGEVRVA